ncbi:CidA/LrgA family holin-like protein [uncultured Planococcus sp.]|uniref:CidA/LrgA family protein n=1 Tax=uncultured Planococcus sp. TaxID=337815 RepID=UPI0026304768|nr:CidA/LrgA family holin-like protein [uncultured Planococcus sp.]
MKIISIILQLLAITGFYLIGEAVQDFFNIPLPGSIIGFLLLFAALMLKIYPLQWIDSGAHFLLAFLSLYFIPATVGVVEYGELFSGKGMLLIPIVIISTFLTMAAAGWVSQYAAKASPERKERS